MEMLVVIAMMGVTMYLGRIGLQLLFDLQHQGMRLQSQREAQAMLYLIAKDVRNAKSIETREDGKLVLNAFDLTRGFDVNAGLNLNNSGTITYEYMPDPQGSFLQRTAVFGPNTTINKYLRGVLIPPTAGDFIFKKPVCGNTRLIVIAICKRQISKFVQIYITFLILNNYGLMCI
jgi:hypothetical protein